MTLENTTNRVQYSGDGATVLFPITFVFWSANDLQVTHADVNGVETTWTRGTQYTITGGSGATGALTVVTSPTDYTPAGGSPAETLTIKSNLPNTQPTALPLGGALPTPSLERQLDQMVRQLQQFGETSGRSITLNISSTETNVTIADLTGNAGKILRVAAGENALDLVTIVGDGEITLPVTLDNGGTGAATAPLALSNIGGIGAATTDILTNKTLDANATGNAVSNLDTDNMIAASQAEAEAGTDETKVLSSLRVAQSIAARATGGLVSITNTALSATTNIDFTGFASGTYDNYKVNIANVRPSTDAVALEMETSTDGGSNYDVGASDYSWSAHAVREDANHSVTGDPDDTEIQFISSGDTVGNATNENLSAEITIHRPEDAQFTAFSWTGTFRSASTAFIAFNGGGSRQSAADVDAIRFHWSSGDFIAQGAIQFLGIKQ